MDTYSEALEADLAPGQAAPVQPSLTTPSLRRRLLVLVGGSMLPVLILAAAVVVQGYRRAEQAAQERVLQITRSTMATVDRELENRIAALEVLALSPALQAGDFETFRGEAERFLSRIPSGAGISISERSGRQLMNTNAAPGEQVSPRIVLDAIEPVFTTKKPHVSDMFIGRLSNRPIFTIEVPVMRGEEVVYDLAFNPPRSDFIDVLTQLNLPQGWIISIFDRNAHHVARIPARNADELTSASETLRPHLLANGSDLLVDTVSLEGVQILTAITRSEETGWTVAMGIPVDTISGPARETLLTTFTIGGLLLLVGLAFASRLATHLMRAEAHRELLVNELNHRVKNTLSSVQAIVARGLAQSPVSADQRNAIEMRLLALSHVHNILSSHNWEGADLHDIAGAVLEPYAIGARRRVIATGPAFTLPPRLAIPLALVLNEMVTNAAKYGALSTADGVVTLSWRVTGARLRITWEESGGPPVRPPQRSGYGTRFIERAVSGELAGNYTATYAAAGLSAVIEIDV